MTNPEDDDDGFLQKKWRPTERQYAAIGRVAAMWSEVELAMESILGHLALSPSLLGHILTAKLGPDNRIGAIESLVHVHQTKYEGKIVEPEVLSAIEALLRPMRKMKDDRNFVVHTVWSRANDESMSHTDIMAAARSGKDFSGGPTERLADIEAFGEEIRKLADRLWKLARRIPTPEAALLGKLQSQEQRSRLRPHGESMRQVHRRSYGTVEPKPKPPRPQRQDRKRREAKA